MTLEQRLRALSQAAAFRGLPREPLATLAASMREESFADGEVLVASGERADRVFVLCGGALEVTTAEGAPRRLEPGALLGELAFFAGAARTATVVALGPCTLLSLRYEAFRAFLLRHPESLLILTSRIARSFLAAEAGQDRHGW